MSSYSSYAAFWKRCLDLTIGASVLVCLSPLLAILAAAVWLADGRPVLFRQTRVGRDGKPFQIFKFRSMRVNSGDVPSDQAAHLRITAVGRVLRRTNLDELPQLLNIVRGEMSLVGPRPALPQQNELLRLRDRTAGGCRPGLTGLAQVNSYDRMPVSEKAAWDNRYAARITCLGDLHIVLRTFRYLLQPPPTY